MRVTFFATYLNVKQMLDDPYFKRVPVHVPQASERTFWTIPDAWDFGQACQILAKRGLSVDACTCFMGSGKIGLSSCTTLLANGLRQSGAL